MALTEADPALIGDTAFHHRNRIFFLSYYVFEKGPPLTYLTRGLPRFYERYLEISGNDGAFITCSDTRHDTSDNAEVA